MNANRKPLYAKIAIARKQLPDMDEEAYRALLEREFDTRSTRELNWYQLTRLLRLLADLGVEYLPKNGKKATASARPDWIEVTDSMPHAQLKREICAIWRKLGYSMTSLDSRVKKAFGTPVFLWMQDFQQLSTLLSDLQRREKAFDKKQGRSA